MAVWGYVAGAAISAIGSWLGGSSKKKAAQRAAEAQERAANASIAEQRRQYDTTRADMAPWMRSGKNALYAYEDLIGLPSTSDDPNRTPMDRNAMLTSDPSYQFRLKTGEEMTNRKAAAAGGYYGGNAMKELSEYGQNFASTEFSAIAKRLADLSGLGRDTSSQVGQFGANTANQISNNLMKQGSARADAENDIGNARAGMYEGIADSAGKGFQAYGKSQGWWS